jgi:hypothetical protein
VGDPIEVLTGARVSDDGVAGGDHRDLDRATNTRLSPTNHANVATARIVVASGIASAPERSNH